MRKGLSSEFIQNNFSPDASQRRQTKALLQKNGSLHNRHVGQRCFILATGPSIKRQNLTPLKNEICIAVSNFFVHPDYHLIKPRYYCLAPFHSPITEEGWQEWMDDVNKAIGDSTLFYSVGDITRNQMNDRFQNRVVHYLDFRGTWDHIQKDGVDLRSSIPAPQSVPTVALLIALYMGFQEIYLLGCDHDWILHMYESRHFYDENQHALNRSGYNEWDGSDLGLQCQGYIELWNQYRHINQIAQERSTKIVNCTDGGLLDIFPRQKLEDLFIGIDGVDKTLSMASGSR